MSLMSSIIKQIIQATTTRAPTPNALKAAASTAKAAKGRAARLSGYNAEAIACDWLITQGLSIVTRNVRYAFGEIDIVAWQGNTLVLFEVRLRKNTAYGSAADSITPTKQKRLMAAALAYSAHLKPMPMMRIDVLTYEGIDSLSHAPTWLKNVLG
jgi:putative endonuclease